MPYTDILANIALLLGVLFFLFRANRNGGEWIIQRQRKEMDAMQVTINNLRAECERLISERERERREFQSELDDIYNLWNEDRRKLEGWGADKDADWRFWFGSFVDALKPFLRDEAGRPISFHNLTLPQEPTPKAPPIRNSKERQS